MGTDRKVRLVATESQKYGTRQLRPGDAFEADEPDADDILALGIGRKDVSREIKAVLSEALAKQTDAAMTGLSVKQATKRPAKPVKPKRKYIKSGLYKRRDMRAED